MNEKKIERAREAVAEAATGAREVLEDGLEQARERFEEVAEDLERGARRTQRELRRRAERLSEGARERYEGAVDSVKSGYLRVRKDAGELADDVTVYVKENPGKSMLIAAGAGFVLGLLIRGRRREDY
jgi:ElaB/YqjD/DUF883 family membrane-anchored ribosome-binding protein